MLSRSRWCSSSNASREASHNSSAISSEMTSLLSSAWLAHAASAAFAALRWLLRSRSSSASNSSVLSNWSRNLSHSSQADSAAPAASKWLSLSRSNSALTAMRSERLSASRCSSSVENAESCSRNSLWSASLPCLDSQCWASADSVAARASFNSSASREQRFSEASSSDANSRPAERSIGQPSLTASSDVSHCPSPDLISSASACSRACAASAMASCKRRPSSSFSRCKSLNLCSDAIVSSTLAADALASEASALASRSNSLVSASARSNFCSAAPTSAQTSRIHSCNPLHLMSLFATTRGDRPFPCARNIPTSSSSSCNSSAASAC
mmetsp:Transcript_44237/g.127869  ORF Transcript_44237/g.127869 Transcript_44237/m.127869 type:complete len:327 (+) Transcript_44237:1472-2452(+)